ncbi:hypothetical protein IQ250_14720 [Pseudanabaenaceae cyanobacterium LEGE 13415]|nr:hypothetical protein [Pseudanabaenaceae cyanobacterium LEGE 13415]
MNRKVLVGLWIGAIVIAGIGASKTKFNPSLDSFTIRINLTETVYKLRQWNRTIAPEQSQENNNEAG